MFGGAHIIDILRGADTAKIRERGHERLRVYGAGKAWKANDWRALVRQMNAGGFLRIDADYGGLSPGPRAPGLLRGETRFAMRPEPRTRQRQETAALAKTPADRALYDALKAKRLEIARERGVAAFVIFSDRTLLDMAARKPKSLPQFGEVFGVGRAKTEAFGPAFLRVIAGHLEESDAA